MDVVKVKHGKKTSIDTVRFYAEEKGGKLLSLQYKNALGKLDWQCKEEHVFSTTFNHVKNRGQWCPVCGQKQGLANMRKRFSEDPSIREKISKGHLKRLNKLDRFTGHTQRDLAGRIREGVTGLIRKPSKHKGFLKYLGCSLSEYLEYLESKFLLGMTWENRGFKGWHIDHIKPLNLFNLQDIEQYKQACHYTNLQPLWAIDNQVKYDKYIKET
jgi:hypothetical protein